MQLFLNRSKFLLIMAITPYGMIGTGLTDYIIRLRFSVGGKERSKVYNKYLFSSERGLLGISIID